MILTTARRDWRWWLQRVREIERNRGKREGIGESEVKRKGEERGERKENKKIINSYAILVCTVSKM